MDRFFTYRVPLKLEPHLKVGQYLKVPWGKKEKGAVVKRLHSDLSEDLALEDVKFVTSIVDPRPLLGEQQFELLRWLRLFYFGNWPETLRCVLPGPVLQGLRRGTKSRTKAEVVTSSELETGPELTVDQRVVWDELVGRLGESRTYLLHGVTGSGKTEIYLRATATTLAQGKTVLVLVPEVALTPQTQSRYRKRFGSEVSILHSGLTAAQRREQWWRIRDGHARVVVGTRSAVFAPLQNCALIILDEEHDSSYKQSSGLRYHARQVAAWLSRSQGATILLGSATPSLESYTLAKNGRYQLLEMPRRISGQAMPKIRVMKGHGIPHEALRALEERRAKGEQAVILLNRRGFSNYLQCRECAWVPECPNCSISLTFHRSSRTLRCHYCGGSQPSPSTCADCGGVQLEYPGRGTERVEQELLTRLPQLRVKRLDRDTVGGRSSVFGETFQAFKNGEIDCILGTQMVAKGLDFPNVTLVLVLEADTGLHVPDFRAAERTFSLLTQVAGRAGRGDIPGEVLLVCRKPEQPLFDHLRNHRWLGFMLEERSLREAFSYPPFSRLIRLLLSDEDPIRLERNSQNLGDLLSERAEPEGVAVLGPAPCPLEKLQGRFRWHILLRASRVQDLQNVVRKTLPLVKLGKTRLSLDPDPTELM